RLTILAVSRRRQGTRTNAVKTMGERHYMTTLLDLSRQLERSLDSVRSGWPRELQDILHAARFEQNIVERFKETFLGGGRHIQAVNDAVLSDVIDQGLLHFRIVMTIVQRACAGEKIDIVTTRLIG